MMSSDIISSMSEAKQRLLIIDDDPYVTRPLITLLEFFFKRDNKNVDILFLQSLSELKDLFSSSEPLQGEFFLALVDSLGQDWKEATDLLYAFSVHTILFSLDPTLVRSEANNNKLAGTMDKNLSSTEIYNRISAFLKGN